LQVLVLGPLEVRVADRVVPLGGPQQRLLMAALAANVNQVVTADGLVEILWDGQTPSDDGKSRLAKAVYRLRATIEAAGVADAVVTRAPGYVLSVAPEVLDCVAFTELVTRARAERDPQRAVALLDEALALWRGPAWADVADEEFVRADAARLEGLRAVALEERSAAMLASGRHAELVPQLETIIERYPLRERPRAQLMLALYNSDRQAEAMAAYGAFRDYLSDEMGLDPSPTLQRLMDDIAQRRVMPPSWPSGAVDAGVATSEGPCPYKGLASFETGDRAYFAGRERLIDELIARLAMGRFLAVVGPSGSGKSSLVAAGLFGALQSGALPGSERWTYRLMRPGTQPMQALAATVAPLAGVPVATLAAQLESDPAALDGIVDTALADQPGARLVLAVDQFEEIFTACPDRVARTAFIDALVHGAGGRLVVIVAMRADYYGAAPNMPNYPGCSADTSCWSRR
jgi:DNA-binding SARP family transcriptional activator